MGRLVVIEQLTLDGVMQAPGAPDEDRRGGFAYGGWSLARQDATTDAAVGEALGADWALLLGRVTYEILSAYWPAQGDAPGAAELNAARKFVVSRTLAGPLAWNAAALPGDPAASVAALKRREPSTLVVFGSGELVRALLRAGLVDELVLLIHPIAVGAGRRLFGDADADLRTFELASAVPGPSGVIATRYRPVVT